MLSLYFVFKYILREGNTMRLKDFFKFVELQTKIASVTPLLLGTIFCIYRYQRFDLYNFILMFLSLIFIDMATTAINNYIDSSRSLMHNQCSITSNTILMANIKKTKALVIIFTLLLLSVSAGILLYMRTDMLVLIIGMISFATGVFYTFGPIPISRMPLGEIFSGFFMGFVILLLSIHIHLTDTSFIVVIMEEMNMLVQLNLLELLSIFLLSVPCICGIANIMLANNICDLDKDLLVKRYTLPHYIGKEASINLFGVLYLIAYAAILLAIILGILPLLSLAVFLTIPILYRNYVTFKKNPVKSTTFALSVKNFFLINSINICAVAIVVLFRHIQ